MKIGTVTFHCSANFGAVLQSIALVEKLREMGHDARILDYRPEYRPSIYKPITVPLYKGSIKHFLYRIYSIPTSYKAKKEFLKFNKKHMKMWEQVYFLDKDIENQLPELDVIITGSDQVWNPERLGAVDKVYFLAFGSKDIRRISYAPSFGTPKVDERYWDEISTYIKKLDAVSIREREGKDHIKELTGIEAEHVLDPVFLLKKERWVKFLDDKAIGCEPFLLLYARERSRLLSETARKIAREKGLKIVNISKIMMGLNKYDKNLFGIGPGHFLELFKKAEVVCTNSFHGTAFSIIFEKPFVVTPHRTKNTRIESVLDILDLSAQQIRDVSQLNKISSDELIYYNVDRVSSLLNAERGKSINFLSDALK